MRIGFVREQPRFVGGSERMELSLCAHAAARGHSTWLVHADWGDMVPAYEKAGAVCRQLPVRPVAVRQPGAAWSSISSLARLVVHERLDLVFTSQVNYVSLLGAVDALTGVRTAVHLGLVLDYPSPLFRAGARRMDVAVAPSRHTAEGWISHGWPAGSLRVIPNGVDTKTFHPGDGRGAARARIGIAGDGGPIVAYVGRLVPEKGILTLARAFAGYQLTHDSARLLFVGEGTRSDLEALRACTRELNVPDDAWEIRAPTARPEDIYRAADLIVVPSEWDEPFGLAPLEAMACGTMVIVSDRGLLADLVRPAGSAAVFPSGDSEALSARLTCWLGDAPRREQAAGILAEHARNQFTFDRCGDEYLSTFQSLLS